ncbi:MAG: DUF362 domain-containing protein [Lachnospiraceae bacterium]
MKESVYIIKCESYDQIQDRLKELIDRMGGMSRFAKAGERNTLKANLLGAAAPEQAVSTHPAVVSVVGTLARQEGAIPLIADSPGSGYRYNEATLRNLYTVCGMYEAAEQAGIAVNMDTGYEEVSYPQGRLIKRIEVINPVIQADGVFNLCKMKTHLFMHMTGAVKNHFGIIPGLTKVGYHAKLNDKDYFADVLLDLALYVSPRLSIMDAVLAMEGEGPGVSGTPRHVGLLLASSSPLALDIVAGEIMGLPRDQNPVLMAAERRGLVPSGIEGVDVIGDELDAVRIPDYVFPTTVEGIGLSKKNSQQLSNVYRTLLTQYPVIVKSRCVGCGVCRDSCPQKAITITSSGKRKAVIDRKNCIRCYCCHELCPHKAVETKKHMLSSFFM